MTPYSRTTMLVFLGCAALAASLAASPLAAADTSVEGVVKDARGVLLPGATVSLSGADVVGVRTATTDVDGSYHFRAVPPGTYTIRCGLLGYQAVTREVVVTAGAASAVELALAPTPAEGAPAEAAGPPLIETKTPSADVVLGDSQLHDVPGSANLTTALDNSAGIQLRGFDVAGSQRGQQTPYETLGIRGQNRVVNDGVNTTEGTAGAGGEYDAYAIDEIRVASHGAGVEMSTPGAQVVATWKSGDNTLGGVIQGDFANGDLAADNIDDALVARGATSAKLNETYSYHADVHGPIVKDRAFFYVGYNRSYVDRAVSGQDPSIATEIADSDMFTGKLNVRLSDRDQLTGFGHYSFRQQPNRGLSLTVPVESVLAEETWATAVKGEWERRWSDRLSSTVVVGYFGNEWRSVPTVDAVAKPPRLDTATSLRSGAGWAPFTSRRWKPQSAGQLNVFLPTKSVGSHELKLGWDWQIDRNGPAWSDASGAIRYLDNSQWGKETSIPGVFVDRILFTNAPNQGEADHNQHTDVFAQDVWRINNRLSLTLGLRVGRQDLYYSDVENAPAQTDIFAATRASGSGVISKWNVAPRIAAAIDLTGRGTSVLKGYFGRFYANLGSGLEEANPGGRSERVYEFLDLNSNGLYDGVHELGRLLDATGGGTPVDAGFALPYSDELGASFEQELATDLGFRVSYVHKRYRNWWSPSVNVAQALNLTNAVTAVCAGCPAGLDGSTLHLLTIPDGQATLVDTRIMNVPLLPTTGGDSTDMNFDAWQVALTRRFRGNFFLNASFDKVVRDDLRGPDASTSPFVTDPLAQEWFQNHSVDVANRQQTKTWNAKLLTRYVAPYEFGLSVSLRYQSGFEWAPVYNVAVPNVGTKATLLTNLEDNRSDDVAVVDLRLDKSFRFHGHYRLTASADVYNLFNANPATNFVLNAGSRFEDVIEWLPGTTLRLGLRLQF